MVSGRNISQPLFNILLTGDDKDCTLTHSYFMETNYETTLKSQVDYVLYCVSYCVHDAQEFQRDYQVHP